MYKTPLHIGYRQDLKPYRQLEPKPQPARLNAIGYINLFLFFLILVFTGYVIWAG